MQGHRFGYYIQKRSLARFLEYSSEDTDGRSTYVLIKALQHHSAQEKIFMHGNFILFASHQKESVKIKPQNKHPPASQNTNSLPPPLLLQTSQASPHLTFYEGNDKNLSWRQAARSSHLSLGWQRNDQRVYTAVFSLVWIYWWIAFTRTVQAIHKFIYLCLSALHSTNMCVDFCYISYRPALKFTLNWRP